MDEKVGDVSESTGYAGWLSSLDDAALASLLARRPEALARPLRSFSELASLLSSPMSVDEALRQLDRSAVQVAGVLGTLGPSTSAAVEAALARSGDVPAGHVAAAIGRLTAVGLAWPDARGRWLVPKPVATMAGLLCGLGPSVLVTLDRTQLFLLRQALEALGLGGARSVHDAVFTLSEWARDEEAVGVALQAAPQSVHDALAQIALHGPVRQLDAEAAEWLSRRCLLVPIGHDTSTVPAELVAWARGNRVVGVVRTEPIPAAIAPPSDPEPLLAIVAGMRALLERLDRTTVKPLQSGGIGVQEQRRLAKALDADHDAVRRLLHLAGDAGLLSTGARPGLLTTAGVAWLERDEVPAAVELALAAVDAGRVELGEPPPLWGPPWQRSRPSLRTALAGLVGRPDRPPLPWLTWRWFGAGDDHLRGVVSALEWLGLVTPDGVQPWAAAVAAGDEAAAVQAVEAVLPPEQDDVVLQADGTAIVAGRPSNAVRKLLDRVARRESDRTWRLDADRVRAAMDAGAEGSQLLQQLAAHSRHAVPQVVEQLVHDVAEQHGRIVVVPSATLLRVDDAPLAITLLRDRKLVALALSEVQPGLLASAKKPADVLAALRTAGYAPVGPPEPARKRPAATRVQPLRAVPNIDPDDAVRMLRQAPPADGGAPAGGVLRTHPAPRLAGRLDHLPVDQRLLLTRALEDGRPVEIDYVDSARRLTTRVVDDLQDAGWLLEGWCRLRGDGRSFAPDGILAVRPVS